MRCSNNFTCLLLSVIVLPFCLSRDTLTVSRITYPGTATLVSAGERFELGFFSPNRGSDSRWYVGIWYYRSNPRIIVWVANRDDPLVGSSGSFGLVNCDLKLWDGERSIRLTTVGGSISSTFAKLLDSGNLVLVKDDGSEGILWQSFSNPTDTFLPGMRMTGDLKLTSWASPDDPKPGNFTFRREEGDASKYQVIRGVSPYWKRGVYDNFPQADQMWYAITSLLSNFTTGAWTSPTSAYQNITFSNYNYNNPRLVMNYDGQIQYFGQADRSNPFWSQPAGPCSVLNACGKFQSCNDENSNETMCRCLPGFELRPGGCVRKSSICGKNSTFLSLKMMKAGNPDNQIRVNSKEECKTKCLGDCHCQAYWFKEDQRRGADFGNSTCYTWSEDLDNMQEFARDGHNLYVRVQLSDIG